MPKKKAGRKNTTRRARPVLYDAGAMAAQLGALTRGMHPDPAATAMAAQLGVLTRGMYKKPKRKLTKQEKAARKRVRKARAAYASSAARAARLPGKKKRSRVAPRKKTSTRRASAPSAKRTSKKKVRSVTANQVIANATRKALQTWLCRGPRRSGCGSGGTRVVSGSGTFKRIRPMRFMTAGGK